MPRKSLSRRDEIALAILVQLLSTEKRETDENPKPARRSQLVNRAIGTADVFIARLDENLPVEHRPKTKTS